MQEPDGLSVITYLAQFYWVFNWKSSGVLGEVLSGISFLFLVRYLQARMSECRKMTFEAHVESWWCLML